VGADPVSCGSFHGGRGCGEQGNVDILEFVQGIKEPLVIGLFCGN